MNYKKRDIARLHKINYLQISSSGCGWYFSLTTKEVRLTFKFFIICNKIYFFLILFILII